MKNDFILEESDDSYHSKNDFMSASQLKLLADSGRKYKKIFIDKKEVKENKSLIRGRAIHCFILEIDKFNEEYVVAPKHEDYPNALRTIPELKEACKKLQIKNYSKLDKNELIKIIKNKVGNNNNDFKIWDDIFFEKTRNKNIITESDLEMLHGISDSINEHKKLIKLMNDSYSEVSGYWWDDEFKMKCKFRMDMFNWNGYILEFKSCKDASKSAFIRDIFRKNNRYDIGAAWYVRGYKKITGKLPKGFLFIPVEKSLPFNAAVYACGSDILSVGELGGQEISGYRHAIETYKHGMETGKWKTFQEEIEDIEAPGWI